VALAVPAPALDLLFLTLFLFDLRLAAPGQADLPDLLEALDGSSSASIPEALLRDIEEVNSIGGTQHLREVGELPDQGAAAHSETFGCWLAVLDCACLMASRGPSRYCLPECKQIGCS